MALNCQVQTGAYTRQIAELNAQSMVEIKFSVQDAAEIIAVSPQVCVNSCEISSGRANYGGRLICTLVYTDEDGKLCRVQKGAEFSHYIDDDKLAPAQHGDCTLKCERFQVKRDGSQCVAAVIIGAKIEIFDSAQRSFITDIEGAVCRSETAKVNSIVNFSGESEVEDEFDCVADDVLIPSAEVAVLDCGVRAGVGEISGEIYLSILAVRDKAPVTMNRVVPFKCEIPLENALLSQRAFCRAEIKAMNVNCKVAEERSKCSVQFSANMRFYGHYFDEEEITFVSDAFCKDSEVALESGGESCTVNTDIKVYSERAAGLCSTKAKLDYTCAFMAAVLPRAEYTRTETGVDGGLFATLIYEQGGELKSTEINMPFSVSLSALSKECREVNIAVCSLSLRQRAEGECEGEAIFKITAFDGTQNCVKYLINAEAGAEKAACDCAVSVYLPSAGDGLWETAKRLSETPENIQRTNPELKFPLTGEERIVIYRAKQV